MRTIDVELLRSLIAFEETGSLARAAERVCRTESAISLQMKRLEQLVGRRLFVRSGRRLTLSDDGCVVLNYGRRILALNDELLGMGRKTNLRGRIRIAASQDFGDDMLPSILRELGKRHLDVSCEVAVEGGLRGLEALEKREVDVVLTVGLADQSFARRLQRVRLVWIASPEFEWRHEEPLRLVVFDHQCRFKQRALEELGRRGIPWTFAFKSPSLTGLWAATRANLGVTVRSSFWVPYGLQIVDHQAFGLPDLGDTDVTIHYREDDLDEHILGLIKFIERSILLRIADLSGMGPQFRGNRRSKAGRLRPPALRA